MVTKPKKFNQEFLPEPERPVDVPFYQDLNFDFFFLRNKKTYIKHTLPGDSAGDKGNHGVFWIAPFACVVSEIRESHEGFSAVSGTMDFEKLTGTQGPFAGTAMLASTIDMTGASNTVVTPALTTTLTSLQLARGDRIGLKTDGTITNFFGLLVVVEVTY